MSEGKDKWIYKGCSCERARPPTGVKIPKIRKRGFWGQKTPVSQCTRKGALSQKNPHFHIGFHQENGALGNGSFLIPKPFFSPILGILIPVGGGARVRKAVRKNGRFYLISRFSSGIPREQALLKNSKPQKIARKVDFSEPRLLQCT